MLRAIAMVSAAALSACFGNLEEGQRFSCQGSDDCPSGSRCGGIVGDGSPCSESGFGLPGEEKLAPASEGDYFFLCEADARYYPFCIAEDGPLECDNATCDGSDGKVCVQHFADFARTVCVDEVVDVFEPCNPPDSGCGVDQRCVLVLWFDEVGFIGGSHCVYFPGSDADA